MDSDNVCGICDKLLTNPKVCDQCERLSCNDCLNKMKEVFCPYCRNQSLVEPGRMHYTIKKLKNTLFACKTCLSQGK